jgi:hypothetical protein
VSGRKNIIPAYKILNDQSLGATWQSEPITLSTVSRLAFSVSTSGITNNVGTFSVQHRVYKDVNNYSDWVTLTLSSTPTLADANDQILIDVSVPPGQVRLVFTSLDFETQTLTFPAKAASTGGDYIVFYDGNGLSWAAALNKSGADAAPTGAIYTAIPSGRKVNVDISAATTAASVAALVETAIDALTGLSAVITTDDSAADGTMLLTNLVAGNVISPVPKNANDSGVGSITAISAGAPDGTCDVWISGAQE